MRWRVLIHAPADGAVNMAVDEALFLSALSPGAMPTVRFYRFQAPTLTFGYRQQPRHVCDRERCRELGIACVRRITGGRALLHHHELTYCVAAPSSGVFREVAVKESYRLVHGAIRRGFRELGAPLDEPEVAGETSAREPPRDLPCLAIRTTHEITSGGRKVVASAQKRHRRGFLQHGSILIDVDRVLWEDVASPEGRAPLRAAGLAEILGEPPSERALLEALVNGFEALFGEAPSRRALTGAEGGLVRALTQKYASEAWTSRREDPLRAAAEA